jgi:hypothetical protein
VTSLRRPARRGASPNTCARPLRRFAGYAHPRTCGVAELMSLAAPRVFRPPIPLHQRSSHRSSCTGDTAVAGTLAVAGSTTLSTLGVSGTATWEPPSQWGAPLPVYPRSERRRYGIPPRNGGCSCSVRPPLRRWRSRADEGRAVDASSDRCGLRRVLSRREAAGLHPLLRAVRHQSNRLLPGRPQRAQPASGERHTY